jgi:nickel/cobalt transporter (NiCoT) family protein
LLQVLGAELKLRGWLFDSLAALDFETLGYGIVALFVFGWFASFCLWKLRRLDEVASYYRKWI